MVLECKDRAKVKRIQERRDISEKIASCLEGSVLLTAAFFTTSQEHPRISWGTRVPSILPRDALFYRSSLFLQGPLKFTNVGQRYCRREEIGLKVG